MMDADDPTIGPDHPIASLVPDLGTQPGVGEATLPCIRCGESGRELVAFNQRRTEAVCKACWGDDIASGSPRDAGLSGEMDAAISELHNTAFHTGQSWRGYGPTSDAYRYALGVEETARAALRARIRAEIEATQEEYFKRGCKWARNNLNPEDPAHAR